MTHSAAREMLAAAAEYREKPRDPQVVRALLHPGGEPIRIDIPGHPVLWYEGEWICYDGRAIWKDPQFTIYFEIPRGHETADPGA